MAAPCDRKVKDSPGVSGNLLTLGLIEIMLLINHWNVKSLAITLLNRKVRKMRVKSFGTWRGRRAVWVFTAIFLWLCWPIGSGPGAQNLPGGEAEYPLSGSSYTVRIDAHDFNGQVDQPVQILLDPSPYPPPSGYFYTAVVDVLEKPHDRSPEVLSGDREITVRCPTPGTYRLRIRVNLIAKSSCGGASASIIDEQEVRLFISG